MKKCQKGRDCPYIHPAEERSSNQSSPKGKGKETGSEKEKVSVAIVDAHQRLENIPWKCKESEKWDLKAGGGKGELSE